MKSKHYNFLSVSADQMSQNQSNSAGDCFKLIEDREGELNDSSIVMQQQQQQPVVVVSSTKQQSYCQVAASGANHVHEHLVRLRMGTNFLPSMASATRNLFILNNRNHHLKSSNNTNQKYTKSTSQPNRKSPVLLATVALLSLVVLSVSGASISDSPSAADSSKQPVAQARVGGLDPNDYIDEAGELDIMANQQQIPTAQLMSAAGHLVPDNFFLPGGSIPSLHTAGRYAALHLQQLAAQQQQQQQSSSQQQDALQAAASQVHARHAPAPTSSAARFQMMLAAASAMASANQHQHQQQQQSQQQLEAQESQQLIDANGYNLAAQPDPRDAAAEMDLAQFLASNSQPIVPMFESASQSHVSHQQPQTSQQQQQQSASSNGSPNHQQRDQLIAAATERQIATELAILQQQREQLVHHLQQQQQQQQQQDAHGSMASESAPVESYGLLASAAGSGASIGPEYQIAGMSPQEMAASYGYESKEQGNTQQHQGGQRQQPFGLPTRSSNKEPSGMMKPLGNLQTISSPAIDFVTNQLPKTSQLEKLAEKVPQMQTPTVFSFSSSKDPMVPVKAVNQKKRNVMKQAEQMTRMLIKSINDKFGTNIGDQTDIPFLLSSVGPLGFLQNVLFDPSLLVAILNSAEKTYQSDVLPAPLKQVVRPVLNIFRVPNKKRDKANLLNVVSYLASGGQIGGAPTKHRQGTGIEKHTKTSTSKVAASR